MLNICFSMSKYPSRAWGSFSNTLQGSFSNTEHFFVHFCCQGHGFGPQEAEGHLQTHVRGHFQTQRQNPGVIFKHRHTFSRQEQHFCDIIGKNTMFHGLPKISCTRICFLLTLSLPLFYSSLLFSAFHLSILSDFWILNFL